jgi:two-component system cell cycle sensor histidine kinase/response regulator CckA
MPDREARPNELLAESGKFRTVVGPTNETLRERAQFEASTQRVNVPEELSGLSPEAVRNALHELRVHQIELELQNDELRRTQVELEESRARYFELYDLAPVGYLTIGEKGLIEGANLTASTLLGVARSSLVKQPWTRFIFSEDQEVYFKHRTRLYASGAPHGCELRLVKSGQPFWVRLEASVARSDDETRVVRTVLSDITESKQAQRALQASAARHRMLFEGSADALMTLAPPAWRFSSGNAAALALFGVRSEVDFTSRTPWDYSPDLQPDGRRSDEKAAAMLGLAMDNRAHSFEWTYLRGCEEFRASVTLTRLDLAGSPLLQATVRDETRAHKERTRVAQTERLASMGLLAASVGHEINNPLAYVLSNVEDLAQTLPKLANVVERCRSGLWHALGQVAFEATLGEDAALLEPAALRVTSEQALDALDGARRITLISKALSTFARPDATETTNVELHDAIESAISMAFNEIRFRAKLVKDFGSLPQVRASEGKLSQVFLNLLVNAAHAIDEGDVEGNCITVRTWAEGKSVFAEIQDTGRGIAPAVMERVFEPFFSTKDVGAGAGLGLSICKNIINGFGGDIRVESALGKGARFVVRLPSAEGAAARGAQLEQPPALSFLPGRVLVVDDEALLRTLMVRLLAGHEVVSVSSGKEAQDVLEHDQRFDLILCDLMMPDQTGVDIYKWLKQRNARLAERVVFTSGGAFGEATTQYLAECGVLKLAKPFDTRLFKEVVSERIRSAKSAPPPAPEKGERK